MIKNELRIGEDHVRGVKMLLEDTTPSGIEKKEEETRLYSVRMKYV